MRRNRSSVELAIVHDLSTIAFPSISTGAYGFPIEEAAKIAIETIRAAPSGLEEVIFCCFSPADLKVYERLLQRDMAQQLISSV